MDEDTPECSTVYTGKVTLPLFSDFPELFATHERINNDCYCFMHLQCPIHQVRDSEIQEEVSQVTRSGCVLDALRGGEIKHVLKLILDIHKRGNTPTSNCNTKEFMYAHNL